MTPQLSLTNQVMAKQAFLTLCYRFMVTWMTIARDDLPRTMTQQQRH